MHNAGWIGTGVMGLSMCGHLVDAGYQTTVYSRTASKTAPLAAKGATVVGSPAEVGAASGTRGEVMRQAHAPVLG